MYQLALLAVFFVSGHAVLLDESSVPVPGHFQVLARFQRSVQLVETALTKEISRHKRDTNTRTLLCLNRCMQSMTAGLRELGLDQTNMKSSILLINSEFLKDNVYESYCEITSEGKDCINNCGQMTGYYRSMTKMITNVLQVRDYICDTHRTEFEAAIPCYKKAETEVSSQCDSVCGNQKELLERSDRELKRAVQTSNLDSMSTVLNNICKFVACTFKCHNPVMIRVCDGDTKPGEMVKEIVRLSMSGIQNIMDIVPRAADYYPQTCRNLAKVSTQTSSEEGEGDNDVESQS